MINSCRNCVHLTYCVVVDESKLTNKFCCDVYEQAPATEIAANRSVTKLFGAWALGFDCQPLQDRKHMKRRATTKRRRRHRNG